MAELEEFRTQVRGWLEANCPAGVRAPGAVTEGSTKLPLDRDSQLWLERMASAGWTVPSWPREYGGAGLSKAQVSVLAEELRRSGARAPLAGRGISYIGPTILEFGTPEQKAHWLPSIARGEGYWCMGYSEPAAGSDLASLQTRAEDCGDHFEVTGQKTWTSGGTIGDWMFLLVRTDPRAPKHDGISLLLLRMDQPGVEVRPIRLISGASPFCDTFFDRAIARKQDLIGPLHGGWTVGKRLLQHERSTHAGLTGQRTQSQRESSAPPLPEIAKHYVGEQDGRIADAAIRDRVVQFELDSLAFALTRQRALDASRDGSAPGAATSVFKYFAGALAKEGARLRSELMGVQGLGWDGGGFTADELSATRDWLAQHASTILGGTREIQLNILAKRVLELPD
jgi:alkylation response protein AidB-like acyl-CoA dehydrogenase